MSIWRKKVSNTSLLLCPGERVIAVERASQRCGPALRPATITVTDRSICVEVGSTAIGVAHTVVTEMVVALDPNAANRTCLSFGHHGTTAGLACRVVMYGKLRDDDFGRFASNMSLQGSEYVLKRPTSKLIQELTTIVLSNGGSISDVRQYAFETRYLTPADRGPFAPFSQRENLEATYRLVAEVAHTGPHSPLRKGRGGVLVGQSNLGWVISGFIEHYGRIRWDQVREVVVVDAPRPGVSITKTTADGLERLAVATMSGADAEHLAAEIQRHVQGLD